MKVFALVAAASIASTSAFTVPSSQPRFGTALNAEKKPFFSQVFGMDLFAPNPTVNEYGSRTKKGVRDSNLAILCSL